MKALLLTHIQSFADNPAPLIWSDLPDPIPGPGQVLIKVTACGVCHTELDEIEGRTPPPVFPIILGHQVIGTVVSAGPDTKIHPVNSRVGVAWINSVCGVCAFCREGRENLCAKFQATGRDVNGGYAQYTLVSEAFAYPIPSIFSDVEAAPLLCAGAVGYRSLRLSDLRDGKILGLTGFGASGHLVLKMAQHRFPNSPIFVFARSRGEQDFALSLGAAWAGDSSEKPPDQLDCIIDTTPVWTPVLEALKNLRPGGRLVINAIRKEEIDQMALLKLDYARHLWMEKEIKSVANVTRSDILEFLALATEIPLHSEVQEYPLQDANQALLELKQSRIRGAKVLRI